MRNSKTFQKIITLLFLSVVFTYPAYSQGDITKENIQTDAFTGVELAGSFNIFISQGEAQSVAIEGTEELIKKVTTEVKDNNLVLNTKNGVNTTGDVLKIYIITPNLEYVSIKGSGNIKLQNFKNLNDLLLEIKGSGNIENEGYVNCKSLAMSIKGSGNISINAKTINITGIIKGSGNIELGGITSSMKIQIVGFGSFKGLDTEADDIDVNIPGSGNCNVHAKKNLKVDIKGSGNVNYKGNPKIEKKIQGSGKLNNIN